MSVAHDAVPPLPERFRPLPGSPRGAFKAKVRDNRALCTDHYRLILSVARFPRSVPGQFVQLDCREPDNAAEPRLLEWPTGRLAPGAEHDPDLCDPLAYLRRPFSIADHRVLADGSAEIDVIHRVVDRKSVV